MKQSFRVLGSIVVEGEKRLTEEGLRLIVKRALREITEAEVSVTFMECIERKGLKEGS